MNEEKKISVLHIDERRSLFLGADGITRFGNGLTNGDGGLLEVVEVYKGDELFATYVFKNILGCEYCEGKETK